MNALRRLFPSVFDAAVLIALASVACRPDAAVAAPAAARACVKTCKATRSTCLHIAKRRDADAIGACSGGRAAHRACVKGVRNAFKLGRTACSKLLADCRACCRAGGHGPRCPIGRPVDFTPPPPADLTQSGLPTAASGRPVVLAVPGAQLEVDVTRHDALTALGACARFVTTCVVGGETLDDCARSAPVCGTHTPWKEPVACCASSCFERYQQARRSGTDGDDAFDDVYYGGGSCMPGVADLLRTGSQ